MKNENFTKDVSIIIVNYNTKQLLEDCLNSIYEQTKDILFEVIVSDNGSKDGSIEMLKVDFPQVILIENNSNLGFGTANNRGLAIAKGKYVFYLNSDTILLNNAVKCFFDYWEENGEKNTLGVIGCNLLTKEKIIGALPYGFFNSNWHRIKIASIDFLRIYKASFYNKKITYSNKSKKTYSPYNGPCDYVIGADMFLLNNEFAKFDEDYFMYMEDVHLQFQLKKLGFQNYIIDTPKIIHLEGASSEKQTHKTVLETYTSFQKLNNMISTILFVKKNYNNPIQLFLLRFLTYISMINPKIYSKTKKYLNMIFY